MTDIADNVVTILNSVNSLTTQVQALATAIAAIPGVTPVDLSGVNAKLDTIIADLTPTPPAA